MAYTAQLTDAARTYRERMLPGCEPDLLSTDPEFAERFINFAFGEIIEGTPELDDRTRFMCWIATLLGCQGVDEFRVIAPASLPQPRMRTAAQLLLHSRAGLLAKSSCR